MVLETHGAYWTCDDDGSRQPLYYFAPTDQWPPPYRTQRQVPALIAIVDDGGLAGVDLIGDMAPAAKPIKSDFTNGEDTPVKAFTIHEAREPAADRMDRADALVFVKEGMSWTALVFAPLWLLVNRVWLGFAGYVVIAAVLFAVTAALGPELQITLWGFIALHVLIGLEADNILRWSLDRDGWRDIGAVTGRTRDECERNFFDAWLPQQPVFTPRHADEPSLGARVT